MLLNTFCLESSQPMYCHFLKSGSYSFSRFCDRVAFSGWSIPARILPNWPFWCAYTLWVFLLFIVVSHPITSERTQLSRRWPWITPMEWWGAVLQARIPLNRRHPSKTRYVIEFEATTFEKNLILLIKKQINTPTPHIFINNLLAICKHKSL